MDALPSGLRQRVLDVVEVDDEGHVIRVLEKTPQGRASVGMHVLRVLAFFFAFPFVIFGALVCATLIFAPVGVGIIVMGCLPLTAVNVRMVKQRNR